MKTSKNDASIKVRTFARGAEAGLRAERRAFERQRSELMRRYAGEYVGFSGERVVDHDKDDEVLAARMFRKYANAPFYIGHLEETPSVFELPSPELAG